MNKKRLSKNLIITFCTYAFLLVANIFVSKIVLVAYGSEINGLLSSVNQVFSYVALLEAGIGAASITAFYKPLADKDQDKVNQVYSASLAYYRNILKWYVLCVIAISFLWPFALNTEIDYWTIFAIILIQGISNALTFYFVSATTNYLLASGKNYINVYAHVVITVLTYVAKVAISLLGGHIVIITLSLLIINALKCAFYWLYKKVKCREVRVLPTADKTLLKQKNSFLIHELSGCIFNATDLILISIFCNLKIASVYNVYSMVIVAISGVIGQVLNSTTYLLGDAYSRGKGYEKTHDKFNTIYIGVVFCIYTVAYLLLLPFVSVYTKEVTDINYIDAYLPILFVSVQLLSSCRRVDSSLITIALHAKQTIGRTIAEAVIHLIASLVLVNILGIYGVLLGTLIALIYRSNDIILYTNKHILKRSPWKEYALYGTNLLAFIGFVALNYFMPITVNGYGDLLWKAVLVFLGVAIVYFLINVLFLKRERKRVQQNI